MTMKTDLCTEDMVSHIGTPQLIATETEVPAVGPGARGGGGGGGGFVGGAAGVECGRRLLLAARAGDTATVCSLLSKGAPFATDWLGTSPLHMAAAHAHADTVTALLRAGLSRDARTKVERTPLHVAACAGHAPVVAALLQHGADVDCRDMLRMTPLHWAAQRGHRAAAALLVRAGADPRLLSKFRHSPLSLAARAGDTDMVRLLEEALRDREAKRSVESLVLTANENEKITAESPPSPEFESIKIDNIQTTKPIKAKPVRVQQEKIGTRIEFKNETAESGQEQAGARLLRAHGITLLPTDHSSTVMSALQSGRTIVLSDAGKLMLKESSAPAAAPAPAPTPAPSPVAALRAGGVRLTATPVTRAAPGVKVFTLSGATKLRPLPSAGRDAKPAPIRRVIDPHDLQQVKFVQLPENAKIVSPQKASTVTTAVTTAVSSRARPAVKLVMNRASLGKLLAARTEPYSELQAEKVVVSAGEGVGEGQAWQHAPPEQMSPEQLRAALHRARAQLHALRARLLLYEPNTTL